MPGLNVRIRVESGLKTGENHTHSFGFEVANACNLASNSCLVLGGNKESTIARPLVIMPFVIPLKVVASAMVVRSRFKG
jgi:hypothetical protein